MAVVVGSIYVTFANTPFENSSAVKPPQLGMCPGAAVALDQLKAPFSELAAFLEPSHDSR